MRTCPKHPLPDQKTYTVSTAFLGIFYRRSKAFGAITNTTTRLLTINAPAIALTTRMEPLLAGNFPRMT